MPAPATSSPNSFASLSLSERRLEERNRLLGITELFSFDQQAIAGLIEPASIQPLSLARPGLTLMNFPAGTARATKFLASARAT